MATTETASSNPIRVGDYAEPHVDLRDWLQTRGLREGVLLRAQIAREDRCAGRRDPFEPLLRSERDAAARDSLEVDRGRLTLLVTLRYWSFTKQCQRSTMLAHVGSRRANRRLGFGNPLDG